MDREYDRNEKKQETAFQKFKKALVKIGISAAALGVFSTFLFPITPIYQGVSALIGANVWARTIAFASQLGCIAGSAGSIIANAFKAKRASKEMKNAQEKNREITYKLMDQVEDNKDKIIDLNLAREKSKGRSLSNNNNINYQELITLYSKAALENLRLLNTDDVEDDKDDILGFHSIFDEIEIIKNSNLSDKEKYDKIHDLYVKTAHLVENTKGVEKKIA